MDGVYISAVACRLSEELTGRTCSRVTRPFAGGLGLSIGGRMLLLDARPPSPAAWLGDDGADDGDPAPQPWSDGLAGTRLEEVRQEGLDRILVFEFSRVRRYCNPLMRLIFEMTGRNCNLILADSGSRILACTRIVSRSMSRVRTVRPGETYEGPPSSGAGLGSWREDRVLEALGKATSPEEIHPLLEGVGPATAGAILEESRASGRKVPEVVAVLGSALESREFAPWASVHGPMPIRLGEGAPIADVLSPPSGGGPAGACRKAAVEILEARRAFLERKLEKLRSVLDGVPSEDLLRLRGAILLANIPRVPRGAEEVVLPDWDGMEHRIPLRPGRSAVENAQRYFRKARNAAVERSRLESSIRETRAAIGELDAALAGGSGQCRIDRLAGAVGATRGAEARSPAGRAMGGGWTCLVGRSARENDEITFRIAGRDDIWLHARGAAGAHVVLRHESRGQTPPRAVLEAAAALAAASVRNRPDVVPVDYTKVRYVRKFRGAGPGEVVYTGEKTLFVRLCSARRGGARPGEAK
ncbi:DUF814 domain-containing protein [Candidatus Fermentibacteria bacterium]|nr:DUF814 domain-containing protein [Candidatus Fermentibacteria bacterium]